MNPAPPYLQPGRIGSLTLPNRLVRGATSETMASASGVVYDSFVELYRRLAEGGAGLLLTGHMYVDPRGQASAYQTGIHIHGGNGYLISEFCSPHANTRDDDWGGDAERPSRFFFEVAEAVRAAVGDELPVTARFSVEDEDQNRSLLPARRPAKRSTSGRPRRCSAH